MIDYLKIVVFPSPILEKLRDNKPSVFVIFTIGVLAMLSIMLPNLILTLMTIPSASYAPFYILLLFALYFLLVYVFSYAFWIVGKGFKGASTFIEIRNLFVLSMIPFIIYLPVSLIFLIIGLINSDKGMITHENGLAQTILWILSFRILITGIAKYNKFNWAIAVANWFVVIFVIGGSYYLIKH